MARPTKYNDNVLYVTKQYITECIKNRRVPYISELAAIYLDVHRDTIYEWASKKDEGGKLLYPEFSDTLKKIKSVQRFMLEHGALSGQLNPAVAIFMLKANHGMKDRQVIEHTGKDGESLKVDTNVYISLLKTLDKILPDEDISKDTSQDS